MFWLQMIIALFYHQSKNQIVEWVKIQIQNIKIKVVLLSRNLTKFLIDYKEVKQEMIIQLENLKKIEDYN